MLDFFKRKKNPTNDNTPNPGKGLFTRLKEGLGKTRHNFSEGLTSLFLGKKEIDKELLLELEDLLLSADVGILATDQIVKNLSERLNRNELKDPKALELSLKQLLHEILLPCQIPLTIDDTKKPYVILMIGINGSGKTTTIGKITQQLKQEGKNVILAAGDTFRAAAVEQLKIWGERNDVPVIAQHTGSDSASVIFDALQASMARGADVLIADTAGRLHTQSNLMEELKKVARVLTKCDKSAPHEVMLVLDASVGQNALMQAQKFHEAIGVTGITLTKLDGTAKGGIIFNIAKTLKLPIRFVGVGEGINDLRPFQAEEFVDALFDSKS